MESKKEIFETASGKILRYLLENGQRTIKEIESGLGVTRNAVRVQIEQLESQGLIDSKLVRTERGRPYRVYYVTGKGRDLLPNDYKNLAKLLWHQILKNTDDEKRDEILSTLSSLMADDFRGKITGTTVEEKMKRFVELLNDQGIPAELNGHGLETRMVEYNCPYYEVAKDNPSLCAMELEMMQKLLGTSIERQEWMLNGAAGCQFKVGKSDK